MSSSSSSSSSASSSSSSSSSSSASKRQRRAEQCSSLLAREKLGWLLAPLTVDEFYAEYWEQQPLLLKRDDLAYYADAGLGLSASRVHALITAGALTYEHDVTITKYEGGSRRNERGAGTVGEDAWRTFEDRGCSIRMLCPHAHDDDTYALLSTMEGAFGMFVGSNAYLTPKGTQGFAPHYDDIEALVLQLEGRKHWRVYEPVSEAETLPRVSSKDLTDHAIGEPILDVVLEPGDLL